MTAGLAVGIDARELLGRPTGTGRYLRNLLRRWTATTEDRFFAYFNGVAPDDALLRHPRVEVRVLGQGGSGLVWQELRLPAAARSDRVDVFFSPAYSCPLSLARPRVTAVHDLSFFSWSQDFAPLDGLRRRVLVSQSVRASRAVLACSAFTARELEAYFPDIGPRIAHVPLGPDDDLSPAPSRAEARERLGVRGPMILSVGTILNRRCLPTLLQAMALLAPAWPDALLDVVGVNRTHPRLDIPQLIERHRLGDRVRLSGFTSEASLADRYAAADLAVFLSEYEGFGLPALEAAARGVPLVVAARPALSEIFGGAALLVEPREAGGVAQAIDRLLRDSRLRAELVARGRELSAGHSWSRTAELTRAVLLRAADR